MERIEIARSRFVPAAFLFSGGLVLAVLVLLFDPLPARADTPIWTFMLLAATRFIPVLGCLAVIQLGVVLLRDRRPVLALDEEGVSSRWIRPALLPWSDIAGAHTMLVPGDGDSFESELLCIELRDPARLSELLDAPAGALGLLLRFASANRGTIDIDVTGAELSAARLAAIINGNAGRRRPGSARDAAGAVRERREQRLRPGTE